MEVPASVYWARTPTGAKVPGWSSMLAVAAAVWSVVPIDSLHRECWVSKEAMAARLGLSETEVERGLRALSKIGAIKRFPHSGVIGDARWATRVLWLPMPGNAFGEGPGASPGHMLAAGQPLPLRSVADDAGLLATVSSERVPGPILPGEKRVSWSRPGQPVPRPGQPVTSGDQETTRADAPRPPGRTPHDHPDGSCPIAEVGIADRRSRHSRSLSAEIGPLAESQNETGPSRICTVPPPESAGGTLQNLHSTPSRICGGDPADSGLQYQDREQDLIGTANDTLTSDRTGAAASRLLRLLLPRLREIHAHTYGLKIDDSVLAMALQDAGSVEGVVDAIVEDAAAGTPAVVLSSALRRGWGAVWGRHLDRAAGKLIPPWHMSSTGYWEQDLGAVRPSVRAVKGRIHSPRDPNNPLAP